MTFDVVYPPKGRLQFDGGQNSKFERALIGDNESPECFNVIFQNGAVETRGGSTKFNTTAIGSFTGDGLYTRRDNTGTETMVAFAGGSAWFASGTTFSTIPSAQSVFTAGVRVATTQYENHMFVGNGYVTPYKYNGVAWTRHGVPQASVSGFTGAASGGGSLTTDTYYYKVAFVNSQAAIGNVSTATTAFAIIIPSGVVNLTGIPVAPQSHGVNARRIYRANTTTAGSFGLVATISDNTTTTYSDTGAVTPTVAAPTDNGEPPNYSIVVQHQNRLFMNDTANPNYMWYTELFEPYTVKTTSFQPIGDASQDLVKGVEVYDNGLIVQGERSLYLWYMPSTDPTEWAVIKLRSSYGSKSPFGSFLYNNKLMVPVMQSSKFVGFAAVAGTTIDPDASILENSKAGSDLKSERIEDDMFDVAEAYVGNISAMVYKNRAYISVTHGSNETRNNRIWVFDFSISNLSKSQEAAWSPINGISATQFTVYNGNLYFIDSTATGFVRQLDTTTYSDDSTAINSYYWTKEYAGLNGHENLVKDFRKAYLLVEKSGPYFMNFTYRVDSDAGEGITKQISLDPGSAVWNSFNWGAGDWGGGRDQDEFEVPLGTASGKRIQFKFSNQNTAGQKFKVIGMKFKYNIKGKR